MSTPSTDRLADDELVRLARAAPARGAALEAFLSSVRPRLLRWARGLCGDWDRAEDLAQEALIRLRATPAGLDARDPLAWCYRVLVNLHRDERRTARRREDLLAREGRTPAPAGPTLERDPVGVVHRYLHHLTDRQRAAFQLVDLDGWSVARVADALGAAESTVRVHLHRARRTLRSHILEDLA